MSTIHSPFSSLLIMSNFSSILFVFHQFFTCIALWHWFTFPSHFGKKSQCCSRQNYTSHMLISPCNQSIHMTDGVTVTSFSANLLQKVSVAMDHLCQIALNQKLSSKFQKWCNLSNHVKQNWAKRNHMKWNQPVLHDDSPFWSKCVVSKVSHIHNKSS